MPEEKLNQIRHTLAHLLAASIRTLYPNAQNSIGPAIENGFYQDFDLPETISEKDFPVIEAKMNELLMTWKEFTKRDVTPDEAKKEFAWNKYKVELIEEFSQKGDQLTFYTAGEFVDLCRGGHVEHPHTDIVPGSWKLDRVAGAYWRGDEKNKMLTRIYGLAFESKEKLDGYIAMQEEAKKRDHRKLGKELGLFLFSDLVGPGLPLWTPKGTLLRELLNDYVWSLRKKYGYEKVTIPHITKKELYETSGHWAKYADDLFKIHTRENKLFAMKPMNCPHHTQIFDSEPRSYRDMPQRYCETTMVYRDEQSGELSGLSRVISITQDDAHVFCRESQIEEESLKIWDIIEKFYGAFGFELTPRLSRHDPDNFEKYLGTKETWEKAEGALKDLIEKKNAVAIDGKGEAAFYGPKIDFLGKDSLGREHQVGTIQIDFVQPKNFGLTFTNEKGEKENVVMIHCAIMGSIERFMMIMIEHLGGSFPTWLSPVQVAIIPVRENHIEYAKKVETDLEESGIRAKMYDANDSLGKRIHAAKGQKIPYVIVIGDKEMSSGNLTIEKRDGTKDEQTLAIFIEMLNGEVKNRSLN
ncbi:threonine--tRNA ligase [Candidatus Nomurabacteria bacterium]|jgi:threonyl-tRNA synthetase|nr:MAG: threonine--tRNA ligase [Candidatus Nomurabacteria bacterium]